MDSRTATVVVAQKVDPTRESEYRAWQEGINHAASQFAGFEGAEVVLPRPGVQDEWVVVYRFDTLEHLDAWLTSDERADWLERAKHMVAGPATPHKVVTGGGDDTVTVVAAHRVRSGQEQAYRRWQAGIDRVARTFPGFVSTELFEPVPGEQDEWVVVFRFDDPHHLDRWLSSPERAAWLARAEPFLEALHLHRVGGGLGGWFPITAGAGRARVAARWKQAMLVLLALYPTVMLLRVALRPALESASTSVATLVSNAASVGVLTWFLMPLVTRTLRPWLDPEASARTSALGAAGLMLAYGVMLAGFWVALG